MNYDSIAKIDAAMQAAHQRLLSAPNHELKMFYTGEIRAYEYALKTLAPMPKLQVRRNTEKAESVLIVRGKVNGSPMLLEINTRFDDQLKNGHNTFAITGTQWVGPYAEQRREQDLVRCGCIHDTILKYRPELKEAVRFHLYSTDGPLHYFENTQYHILNGDLDAARASACWPDATDEDLKLEGLYGRLHKRLPELHREFARMLLGLELGYDRTYPELKKPIVS